MEDLVRKNLASGSWPPGYMIPSENELSREFGISRMTVRSVITKLVQEGLLFRIPGKGTYVSEQKIVAKSLSYAGIREQLEQMGYEVSTQLLDTTRELGSEKLCNIFGLPQGTYFLKILRLRFLKGEPLSIHTSYIPADLCPGLEHQDLINDQLCHLMSSKFGLVRKHTQETLESVASNAEEAQLLHIHEGHPLLLLEDTIFGENNKPFEYAKVIFRGDRITITLEF